MTTPHGAGNRRDERRQDQLVVAQIKREERDAAERLRRQRLDDAEERRQRRVKERADARVGQRAARAATLSALGERLAEHFVDLMFTPVIVVPGWLSWDAMSDFGRALYGGPGWALPLLSETAMWIFELAIVRARRKDEHAAVWPLYVGMVAFALICAVLNFMHGLTGPIPGSIRPGGEAGVVYALISVSGIIAHQIVALGGRARKAAAKSATSEVAPAGRGATNVPPATNRGATNPVPASAGGPATRATATATMAPVAASPDRPGGPVAAPPVAADGGRNARVLELTPRSENDGGNGAAKRGMTRQVMRDYWEAETAHGRIPNGAQLNRAAGKDSAYSLGKRYAQEWRQEINDGEPEGDGDDSGCGAEPADDYAGEAVSGEG